ncbi:hypothetical protein SPRG_09296 [Saprolegnia parasitica CBS 223.65]|uniref:Protein kinase domain-containing protein n=1 Tax=Saprolegnia parasitica (strain CBS 223.65) TaxID=695850 RepID=A0A067C3R1_SAPPC|nr:hypothetical protein SPRG_09296 [Saprolegnia parasitica CBS 223.65]KDO25148.1 hypothetical protein SPRG_09296 [Saprolegnia parasitica CBS 223.65]|eukprot:XP_012204216.1 hypothetical protein SPRG_09296 [Saprolegnia parasitica CBS 223.65]
MPFLIGARHGTRQIGMALCKYADLGVDAVVLTADGSCGDGAIMCVVDSSCAVRHEVAANTTRFNLRSGWRLGDLSRYPHPQLELVDLDIDLSLHRYQQLPSELEELSFTSSILASETTTTAMDGLEMPRGLRRIDLSGVSELFNFNATPHTLRYFSCKDCDLTVFSMQPPALTALSLLAPASNDSAGYRVRSLHQDADYCRVYQDMPYIADTNNRVYTDLAIGAVALLIIAVGIYYHGKRVAKTDRAAADDYLISSLTSNELETLQMLQLDASSLVVSDAKPIASGAFGDVWRATYLATNATVVIKRTKDRRPEAIHAFIQEILLLAKARTL